MFCEAAPQQAAGKGSYVWRWAAVAGRKAGYSNTFGSCSIRDAIEDPPSLLPLIARLADIQGKSARVATSSGIDSMPDCYERTIPWIAAAFCWTFCKLRISCKCRGIYSDLQRAPPPPPLSCQKVQLVCSIFYK